jgi:hypothetical protein
VQEIPLFYFDGLNAGDFLFIDSSHIGGPGSDVEFLYETVIPRLKREVFVHIHDIFLPEPYPNYAHWKAFDEADRVQAILDSNKFEVLWSSHFMHQNFPAALASVLPSYDPLAYPGPGSLWLVKR